MDNLQELIESHRSGQITRRDFIQRATLLLGGAAAVGTVVAGGVANAAPAAQSGTPAATLMATMAATTDMSMKLTTKMVEFPAGTQPAPGYLAYPAEAKGPFPAVVVIQEWWGLDPHIKSVAELFARNGYAALAPDLYRGQVAKEPAEAQKLAMGLIMDQAVKDIQGAADYLTAQDFVSPKKVGVIGFCMGGRVAMEMTWGGKENIGTVVSFYGLGGLKLDEANIKKINIPVMGVFGDKDGGIPAATIKQWEDKMKELNKTYETITYKDAPHAFFNDTRPDAFRPEAAKDALARTLAWFKKYLIDAK